ncbi:MAG TPA: hypothetical protein VMB71_08160 [Acetobacteraceae bacterium]|nr:hypothetical protein [Acetobacteraceae bacterium]
MSWDRHREVHVTNRAELDAALRSADRIVVEGDATLTAYAAHLAGVTPATAPAPDGARVRPLGDQERAAHLANRPPPPRLWPWVAGAAALIVAAGAALLLEHFARLPAGGIAPAAPPLPHEAPAFPRFAPGSLTTLAWPGVAVVLIVAVYFITRQAITSGRDVQIAWQLTEKVGGRVVITKVRARSA